MQDGGFFLMMEDTEQKRTNASSENGILWVGKFLVSPSTATTTLCAPVRRVSEVGLTGSPKENE